MPPKWIDEKVLQRYWIDRCNIYEVNGKKIESSKFNIPFNRYPDVYTRLSDGSEVPAEVEWKTSDFDHDIQVLKDNEGFLIVYNKDRNFIVNQVVINHKDFIKWFKSNSKALLDESLKAYQDDVISRQFPKIWLRYNNDSNNENNMEVSLKLNLEGFPKKTQVLTKIKDTRPNDLVLVVGPYKSATKGLGGRVPIESFKGTMRKIILFKVTTGYYYDTTPTGWKGIDGELFPHRFGVSKPLLEFANLQLDTLSLATRHALNRLVAKGFWEADPTHFVELLSQANLFQSQIK